MFSKLHLRTGFHQTRVKPEDREKTAFTTKYGQYESKATAMTLCNAAATFYTPINSISRDVIDEFSVVYLDSAMI